MRPLHAVAIAALSAALWLASAAAAGELYQWKDANGVTHYSQTPPATGPYEQRTINRRAPAPADAAPVAAPAGGESPQCVSARSNLAALQGSAAVHELGADGKPGRVLTATERASQIELANAGIKAYCRGA